MSTLGCEQRIPLQTSVIFSHSAVWCFQYDDLDVKNDYPVGVFFLLLF